MNNQLLKEMDFALNKMEDTGEVDLGFLENISNFRHHINKIKTQWLEYTDNDGFYFYQAARNMELILGKMYVRFENAKKMNDNPVVALDTLALLPQFDKTLSLLERHDISAESIDKILDQTRILRDTAASKNLIESIEIDRNSLDTDNLKTYFTSLMDQLSIQPNHDVDYTNNDNEDHC